MNHKPNLVKVDRGEFGRCNICLKKKKLSWEHIIPSSAFYYDDIKLKTINQHLHGDQIKYQTRLSQNGVKLRTVCSECNSEIGYRFDRSLIEVLDQVKELGESNRTLPNTVHVKCRPNALIRSLIAHLLAAKIEIDFSVFENVSRKFVCDLDKQIPDSINVFYWAYPYKNVSIIRDVLMLKERGNFQQGVSLFQIFKCYPLAFLVTDLNGYEGLQSLNDYKNMDIEEEINLPVKLFEERAPTWPENTDNNIITLGQAALNSVTAIQRKDENT